MKRPFLLALLVSGLSSFILQPSSLMAAPALTYADLIRRMTDLAQLAVLPAVGENCGLCSSYDRASQYDAKTGKYVNWAANGDGGGIIRREGDQVVMAEMKGPGCIWRIWSARAEKGHVKIYLDDQPQPAVDMPFCEYFDGRHAPFAYPALSYNLEDVKSHGQNLYLPIPYQKSCKVVADKGWGSYYHFNYASYPAGTKIPTFSAALAAKHAEGLKAVNRFFAERLGEDPAGKRPGAFRAKPRVNVLPGETATVLGCFGPGAITSLKAKIRFSSREEQMAVLRKLVLRITWDDQPKPAVWCPLGDFFGTAPGVNLYKTLMSGMTDEGFYSYWYMPFEKGAKVELTNDDTVAHEVEFEVVNDPPESGMAGLGYFHCKWHRDTIEPPLDRWPDWVMLQTQGCGRFCGVMLHVWNPRGGWWGEGDEKFFVDGEKFPSTIGTGSEDYFGYAWCDPHLFQRPYHAQTLTEQNRGHQSVLRWHITDNVPFHESFQGCIEKYFKNERGTLYACSVRWYLAPGGVDPYDAVPVRLRDGYYVKPVPTVAGLKLLNEPRGEVEVQPMGHYHGRWKNNEQLWWKGAKPGARMELGVAVPTAGRYEVSVNLTKARDYAIVQLSLDGRAAGGPIDLYNPQVIAGGPIVLGIYDLSAGQHKLMVEIVGANAKAAKSYMFGIDRVEMKADGGR